MNDTNDQLRAALDRVARIADDHHSDDPMPGITRKARANRRRATLLVAASVAVIVAGGVGVAAVVDSPTDQGQAPGYSGGSKHHTMATYDRARADVDGDGATDRIRIMLPRADASSGKDASVTSSDVRLRVDLSTGATTELRMGDGVAATISGTPDLDDDGAADIVLSRSGGDLAQLTVFTWADDTVVQAKPSHESPQRLLGDDGSLLTAPEVASAKVVDGEVISWVPTDDTSSPYRVRVWAWQLDQNRLVATRVKQRQCVQPGQDPEPC